MKTKSMLWILGLAVIVWIVYSTYQDARANPQAYQAPDGSPLPPQASYTDRLMRSVNDVSWNLLFGWWLNK